MCKLATQTKSVFWFTVDTLSLFEFYTLLYPLILKLKDFLSAAELDPKVGNTNDWSPCQHKKRSGIAAIAQSWKWYSSKSTK